MTTSTSKSAAGSVGTVDTQYVDLPRPLRLDCGRELHPIRVAYETYGTLAPSRDNVILVCHALSGDAHAAGFSRAPSRVLSVVGALENPAACASPLSAWHTRMTLSREGASVP